MSTFDAEVAIVGAGPVGLTLAIDLAARGRSVVVLETRARGEPPNVKCNHVAARTMEQFRRLGLAADVRGAGLPADYPNDVVVPHHGHRHRAVAHPRSPAARDRYSDRSGPDGWWPTPEPPHRINQIYLEPILFAHAEAMPGVTITEPLRGRPASRRTSAASTIAARDLDGGAETTRARRATWSAATAADRWCARRSARVFAGTPVDPARAVDATSARRGCSALVRGERGLELLRAQPAPQRHRASRSTASETWLVHNHLHARARPTSTRSTATACDPHHPRRRRRLRVRDHQQGGLDRPPPRRRPLPRPAASSSPATPRTSGCRTPATA